MLRKRIIRKEFFNKIQASGSLCKHKNSYFNLCGKNNNCHSWQVDCFVEAMDFLLIFKPEGLTKSITVMIITKY